MYLLKIEKLEEFSNLQTTPRKCNAVFSKIPIFLKQEQIARSLSLSDISKLFQNVKSIIKKKEETDPFCLDLYCQGFGFNSNN